MSDFPETGQEGVVYVSTSDNKAYSWALVPDSLHYQTIAAQLTALKAEYETELRPYQQEIENLENEKAELDSELETCYNENRRWLIQEKNLNKQLSDKQTEKDELDNEIAVKTEQKEEYEAIVAEKNIEIAELQDELDHTTNPIRRQELEQMIQNATTEKNSAQMSANNIAEDIAKLNSRLALIEADIADLEFQLVPIEEELEDYYETKDRIEQEKEVLDEEIAAVEQEMDAITETYTENRTELLAQQGEYVPYTGESLVHVQATDWRSELYLAGAAAEPLGLESNYYYAELAAEWPKLYNLQASSYIDSETGHTVYTGAFYDEILENPWDVDYWLDFIDSDAAVSMYNVSNIGRRSIVKSGDEYNCVFESEVPDIVIIETGEDAEEQRKECEARNQDYCQVGSNIYDALSIGGYHNSCFNEIKNLLWFNTNYGSSISISTIPIYHLEPNTRITITSDDADIHGDFLMTTLSIPLTISGNTSISATQVQTKL